MSVSFRFIIIKFIKTIKIDGYKTLPCLTPESTAKEAKVAVFQRTTACNLVYQLAIILIMLGDIPTLSNECNNLKWFTLSKALLISSAAIKTELLFEIK
jgi:hypothetical protein